MKWMKRIIGIVVILLIVIVAIVYFSLNSIVRSAVQRQSTASLGVSTSLDSAKLALFGGTVSLSNFDVDSPSPFTSPHLLTLQDADVQVHYGQLTSTPMHVSRIVLNNPALVVEHSGTQLNLQALMNSMPKPATDANGQPVPTKKLIIDEMDVNNAQVEFHPGIPGLKDTYTVPVPSLILKNVGNADGNGSGAAIKDVVMQLATALAAKAGDDSSLPPALKTILSGGLSGISQQLGGDFNKQLQSLSGSLMKNVPGNGQNLLNTNDGSGAAGQLQQGLQGLFNKSAGSGNASK